MIYTIPKYCAELVIWNFAVLKVAFRREAMLTYCFTEGSNTSLVNLSILQFIIYVLILYYLSNNQVSTYIIENISFYCKFV